MYKGIITVVLDIKTPKVKDELEEAITSMNGFQVFSKPLNFQNPGSYDLFILEIGDDPKELQFASELQASGIAKDVFFTTSNTASEILIEALKVGVKGFFPQPINKEDVRNALLKIRGQKEEEKVSKIQVKKGKIISVIGSKGGVGTTTVAVNLAISLAELESSPSVALIDMNRFFGEISLLLNIEPVFDWVKITKNISRLDETYLMSILTKHPSGIYVLPSPVELTEDYTPNLKALKTLLKQIQTIFDYTVIDNGQSLDNSSNVILQMADKVFLVSMLNLPCIINLKKLQDVFLHRNYPPQENIEIIVNRVHRYSDISLEELEESINKKVLCSIPNAYKISMSAINQGKPLCTIAPGTEISNKFKELASTFQEKQEKKKKKPILSSIFSITSLFSQRDACYEA